MKFRTSRHASENASTFAPGRTCPSIGSSTTRVRDPPRGESNFTGRRRYLFSEMRDTVAEFDDLGDRKRRIDASVAAIVWRLHGIRCYKSTNVVLVLVLF